MVGAYDWDGGVLKEGIYGRIVPSREAFESEFPLELKNHAAYLGTLRSRRVMNNSRAACQRSSMTLITLHFLDHKGPKWPPPHVRKSCLTKDVWSPGARSVWVWVVAGC